MFLNDKGLENGAQVASNAYINMMNLFKLLDLQVHQLHHQHEYAHGLLKTLIE